MITLYEKQSADMKAVLVYETDGAAESADGQEEKQGGFLSVKRMVENGAILLRVGLGKKEELTLLRAKRAGAKATKALMADGAKTGVLDMSAVTEQEGGRALLTAMAEGAALAQYKPKTWKKDSKKPEEKEIFIDAGQMNREDALAALREAFIVTTAVTEARDLVNEPPNYLTPEAMAATVKEKAEAAGIEVQIFDRDEIKKMGMGAFLAVGDSSGNPPRLMVLRYRGNPDSETVLGYVGKGITYDTGGYSLKPAGSMKNMKDDMGGGAAVFAAVLALAKRGARVNVTAVIPAAENRISNCSYLPGDIITSMSGRTIEIGNTDAEGRLLLADGMTYAIEKEKVTHLVDIATLTGAVVTMFGSTTAGLMTNDDGFCGELLKAADQSAEQYWRLPDFEEYRDMIQTPNADMQNVSKGGCGTITAGLFVSRFNEDLPWVHLDIAGTAFTEKPLWEFLASGATGAGVTTLYRLGLAFEGK